MNGMPEDPAKKRRHPGGRPKEAREEYRPVTVFGHEFPAAVVHVVEYAPTFERSLHARGITFADVKTADIADIPPAMQAIRVSQIERNPAALNMPPA